MKKALAATNPAIRTSGMSFLQTLYRYMGSALFNHLDAAKVPLKPQMKQEIEKNGDQKPPAPTKGLKKVNIMFTNRFFYFLQYENFGLFYLVFYTDFFLFRN